MTILDLSPKVYTRVPMVPRMGIFISMVMTMASDWELDSITFSIRARISSALCAKAARPMKRLAKIANNFFIILFL